MRRPHGRFSRSDASYRTPWWADWITDTLESRFPVHTGLPFLWKARRAPVALVDTAPDSRNHKSACRLANYIKAGEECWEQAPTSASRSAMRLRQARTTASLLRRPASISRTICVAVNSVGSVLRVHRDHSPIVLHEARLAPASQASIPTDRQRPDRN